MRKVLPIILIAVAIAAGAYVGYRTGARKPEPRGSALVVSFLAADLGNAIVVETPEKNFVVVDPGPERTADDLVRYLRDAGAQSLTVVITNPSEDHVGALDSLLDTFPVKRILRGEIGGGADAWTQSIAGVGEAKVTELILCAGDVIRLSPTVKMEVLSPPKGLIQGTERMQENNSLVARLSLGRTSFLLASDAMVDAEGYVIRSCGDLRSNVLVAGRHGQTGSTSLELLSRVRPDYCIVMAGSGANRPSKLVLNRISTRNTGAKVYRTDKDGSVDMVSDGRSISVETGVDWP